MPTSHNRPVPPSLLELVLAFDGEYAKATADQRAASLYGFAVAELVRGHVDCAEQALVLLTDEQLSNVVNAGLVLSRQAARVLALRPVPGSPN